MNFMKYLIDDLNYDDLMDYLASTEAYKKGYAKFNEELEEILSQYNSHLSDLEKNLFNDDVFHACCSYTNAMIEESFKFAFANALLLAFESKVVSQETLDVFMKVIKK